MAKYAMEAVKQMAEARWWKARWPTGRLSDQAKRPKAVEILRVQSTRVREHSRGDEHDREEHPSVAGSALDVTSKASIGAFQTRVDLGVFFHDEADSREVRGVRKEHSQEVRASDGQVHIRDGLWWGQCRHSRLVSLIPRTRFTFNAWFPDMVVVEGGRRVRNFDYDRRSKSLREAAVRAIFRHDSACHPVPVVPPQPICSSCGTDPGRIWSEICPTVSLAIPPPLLPSTTSRDRLRCSVVATP